MRHAAASGRGSGIVVAKDASCALVGCAPGPAVEMIGCVSIREGWSAGSGALISALGSASEGVGAEAIADTLIFTDGSWSSLG